MKITDNDIIKALECCSKNHFCGECPNYHRCCDGDATIMIRSALDLINRQKAEIERLNKEVDRLYQCVLYHNGQIVDTVNEFADRFIQEDGYNNHTFDDCASILVPEEYRKGREEKTEEVWKLVERIKKEMVGDAE